MPLTHTCVSSFQADKAPTSSVAFTLETYGHLVPKRGESIAAAFDRLLAERSERRRRVTNP